ncbi:hypothetical protein KGA66_08770 [Actinocrinis puniceicyclus]|uniref:Uncharacterized protein n=1 Tax=Actinocrinis puniceicyclus TaxID=977794 RepID=A0A8J7WPE7_9ACTN|nr:hypothetical protein [Actinocrinis puniceicyclus]MBS2963135.1 hypothetical protein [Actinocrinis puniceicyclus]
MLTVLGAGITAAVVPMISNAVSSGAAKISTGTGLTSPGAPFSWTVALDNNAVLNGCHSWTFPEPITKIPFYDVGTGTHSLAQDETWALDHGGIDDENAAFDITLQGKTDEDVVIRNLRVKVLSRKEPVRGTGISSGMGCGSNLDVRHYSVDLSAPSPQLVLDNADGSTAPPDAQYTVSKSDPEVFCLEAYEGTIMAQHYDETYVYEVDWSQGSQSGTVDISAPDGQPFELDYPPSDDRIYVASNGMWKDAATIQ